MNLNLHSIRWRLPLSYAAIALLAALALGSVMLLVLNSYYASMERDYLTDNARGFQPMVEKVLKTNLPNQFLQDQVIGLSFLSRTQIRVLDNNGETIADSGIPGVDQMVAVSGAPAVRHFNMAVNGPPPGSGAVIIFSRDAQSAPAPAVPLDEQPLLPAADTIYAVSASPFGYGFAVKGVVTNERRSSQVVSIPLDGSLGTLEISNGPAYGSDILRSVAIAWAIAGILSIALAALAGWYASKQVTQPVLVLTNAAHRMEGGNLSARVALPDERQQEFTALAHAFNGMATQVENTVSTLRAFVSDAAHELNTPLTALKTNLELAATESNAVQRQEFLARALEQNQRLEKLTSSLLDLSRIEAAADAASGFEVLDLRQTVAQIGERFASRADQAERNFSLILPDGEVTILGNATQLDRAVSNLFENALKFTPTGGNISLVLEKNENTATLTITDTGIGILPEDLPHLFERFHRGRNSSPYPGNGLGLAIVKASVTAHKGSIQVESQVDKGTNFVIQLPLAK